MMHLGSRISALVDCQLDPAATERALAHVATCPDCARELAAAREQRVAAVARMRQRTLLGEPVALFCAARVDRTGRARVVHAAKTPMVGSSSPRNWRRLRNRWLLIVPSASPVTREISPIGISSR